MEDATRLVGWRRGDSAEWLISREWLVTNALGGYASGTIAGVSSRRYHGQLVAALPKPLGRFVMLNHLEECVTNSDGTFRLSGDEASTRELRLPSPDLLEEFRLERGLPVWIFSTPRFRLEKRIVMSHLQNTTVIRYAVLQSESQVTLSLRPSVHFRPHEGDVAEPLDDKYSAVAQGYRLVITSPALPSLRLLVSSKRSIFERNEQIVPQVLYRLERSRGYGHEGSLWSPGRFSLELEAGEAVILTASTEDWEAIEAVGSEQAFVLELDRRAVLLEKAQVDPASNPTMAQLVLAADQFLVSPTTRSADIARSTAAGVESRTVIAGYHWFTDWGRDTMISLEGLTLSTGRHREASSILQMFSTHIRDGLIPNMFPEGDNEGLYHTADATMWFFHAIARYINASGDQRFVQQLLPALNDIIDHHIRGTKFGIGADPKDGLLRQGAEGYQLTWMDAKVDDWVVTPRRGKAVEINALFYNALRLLEVWCRQEGATARASQLRAWAERVYHSFNARFWFEEGMYLYDVVDGEDGRDDSALRPNQIFAISLDYPVLEQSRWSSVVDVVERELVTPVGLRSLARSHRDYKPYYDGDLRTRDAAYHQGTVWGWLIGPYCDAYARVHKNPAALKATLAGFDQHLSDGCVGNLSEIFDGEAPYTPRGCIAQAWSVAELLRCLKQYTNA